MVWVMGSVVLLAGAVALLGWISLIVARRHALSTPSDEFHRARTPDGWLIGLHRYRPAGDAPPCEPVLLCHGLMACRFSMDLTEERSLARYLRGRGFDVWLMDLRAHGDSVRENGGRRGWDWSIDDYIRTDLPAAVTYVLGATGAGKLHWVGHSLGGMILYAHCLAGERGWFRSAVTIDSPAHLAPIRQPTWPGRLYAGLVPVVPIIVFKPIFHLISMLVPERILYEDLLLDRGTLRLIVYNALVNWGSSGALMQICRMVAEGRFRSLDGAADYEKGPSRIDFPLMVMRAPRSRIPESCVRKAFEDSPAADRRYVRLGHGEGMSIDHNHFSVVMGDKAREDVYPVIAEWLGR